MDTKLDWKPLEADNLTSSFILEFGYFEEFVLKQAAGAIEAKLVDSEDLGSHNLRVGLALHELNKHLALAVQSIWEANFRRWLRACSKEIKGNDEQGRMIKIAPIQTLSLRLKELRGNDLSELPGGKILGEMVLVGNVVRHGDGPSAARLHAIAPDIWLNQPPDDADAAVFEDLGDQLSITDKRLEGYSDAVSEFWLAISQSVVHDSPEWPWDVAD